MRGRRGGEGEKEEFAYRDMDVYTAILCHIMSQWLTMNSLPPCFSHPEGKRSFNFSRIICSFKLCSWFSTPHFSLIVFDLCLCRETSQICILFGISLRVLAMNQMSPFCFKIRMGGGEGGSEGKCVCVCVSVKERERDWALNFIIVLARQ